MSRSGVNKQGGKHRRRKHAQKVCSYCNLSLPLKAFHRRASSPDGFSSRCKRCTKALKQKRRFENTIRTLRRAAEKYEEWRTRKRARRIANDRFAPWGPCAVLGCGKPGRKHHIDYRDPTAVIYLCRDHHCGLHEMIEFLHHLGLTGFTPAAAPDDPSERSGQVPAASPDRLSEPSEGSVGVRRASPDEQEEGAALPCASLLWSGQAHGQRGCGGSGVPPRICTASPRPASFATDLRDPRRKSGLTFSPEGRVCPLIFAHHRPAPPFV